MIWRGAIGGRGLRMRSLMLVSMKTRQIGRRLPLLFLLVVFAFPGARLPASSKTIEWQRIAIPQDTTQLLLGVVWLYNPATTSELFGQNTVGLFESRDSGNSWTRVDDGSFVTAGVNPRFFSLQSGSNGVLYSTDDQSGLYKSENGGRHWTKMFPMNTVLSRVWIDPDRPMDMYLATKKWGESSSLQSCMDLQHSTNAGASFEKVDIPECKVVSVDVLGRVVCYATMETIRCSDNTTTWQSLSLEALADSSAGDRELNVDVELTIDKTNRELVIVSGGKLYETRNGRQVITQKITGQETRGRTIDLVFDPAHTFPAYGISSLGTDGPWTLTKIDASGATESYSGPMSKGFRLKSVDFAHDTFYVWTGEGTFRGVLSK